MNPISPSIKEESFSGQFKKRNKEIDTESGKIESGWMEEFYFQNGIARQSLYDIYKGILDNPEEWDYYSKHRKYYADEWNIETVFKDKNAKEFISQYFIVGGKIHVIEKLDEMIEYFSEEDSGKDTLFYRWNHTVSAFLLGLYLCRLFTHNQQIKIRVDNEVFPFEYFWFLTCLFHDVGYVVEDSDKIKNLIASDPTKYSNINKVLNTIYRRDGLFIDRDRTGKSNRDLHYIAKNEYSIQIDCGEGYKDIKRECYCEKLIGNYFKYKSIVYGNWDHGIVGGSLLFDRLIRNYDRKFKDRGDKAQKISAFCVFNLCFMSQQLPLFYYISQCIAAHNIWKASDEKEAAYRYFHLEDLIGNNFHRINYTENALLYILAIADTLEPIKRIGKSSNGIEPTKILKQIYVWADENYIYIRYESGTDDQAATQIDKLANEAKEWIDIDMKAINGNILRIGKPRLNCAEKSNNNCLETDAKAD